MRKILGLSLVVIFIEALFLLKPANFSASNLGAAPNLPLLSQEVLSNCQAQVYKPSCYDKEIPKLMSQISMEEAFQVTRLVQETDTTYSYCHVLGHNLAAEEVKKDPDKWKEVIARCPSGMCSNGCLHGGFQERFRSESLEPSQLTSVVEELKSACEEKANWKPTGLEQASCYHALGHLAMYLTNADIDRSLSICDMIAIKPDGRNYTKVCNDGTFMQIFQPLEPEDFALVKGKQPTLENVDTLCQKYSGQANSSCIGESWPLFSAKLVANPHSTIEFCAKVEPEFRTICYNGLYYIMTIQLKFDDQKITSYCSQLPTTEQGYCFASASDRMIETDYKNTSRSVNLCTQAPDSQAQDYCFNNLVSQSTFNFHKNSPEYQNLCSILPSEWKDKCLAAR